MSQHHSTTSSNHDHQQDSNVLKDPAFPVGSPGNAGLPTGKTGTHTERNKNYHPPLPGMEDCCRQAALLEFNIRPISLTDEAKAILDIAEQNRAVKVGACLNIYPSGRSEEHTSELQSQR